MGFDTQLDWMSDASTRK